MKIRITDVHKEDAFYGTRDKIIGRVFDAASVDNNYNYNRHLKTRGWYMVDAGHESFYAVKFEEVKD